MSQQQLAQYRLTLLAMKMAAQKGQDPRNTHDTQSKMYAKHCAWRQIRTKR